MTLEEAQALKAGDTFEKISLKTNRRVKVKVLWADEKGALYEWPEGGRSYQTAKGIAEGWA